MTDLYDFVAVIVGEASLPRAEIVRQVAAAGVVPADQAEHDVAKLLQFDTDFGQVCGEVVHTPSLLQGTTWTVFIDATDAAEGFVRTERHLEPLSWWLVGTEVPIIGPDGDELGVHDTDGLLLDGVDTDVVTGPDGWLHGLGGGWATVEVTPDGFRWSKCEQPPAPSPAQLEALRRSFPAVVEHELANPTGGGVADGMRSARAVDVLTHAILTERGAFLVGPIAPLDVLYPATGLEVRGSEMAEPGFDWDALAAARRRYRLGVFYDLDDAGIDATVRLLDGFSAYRERGAIPEEYAGLGLLLEDGAVAHAFATESWRTEAHLEELAGFAGQLAEQPEQLGGIGVGWLVAWCLEAADQAAEAAVVVSELVASGLARDHRPLLLMAAGFAADRSDAPSAYALLDRAGVVDEADDIDRDEEWPTPLSPGLRLLSEVVGFALNRPRAQTGRNDPCPCGSGRKYKACHLGRELHPLSDRSEWLYNKALRYLHAHEPWALEDITEALVGDQRQYFRQFAASPIVADIALHECEVFAAFLESRHSLLPDDEALLAAQWSLVERTVFEVVEVARTGLVLRDVATGEQLTLVNLPPDNGVRKGSVLVGRPLPVGDHHRAFGGVMPLPRASVTAMLAAIESGDPTAIAGEIGRTLQPPQLSNTDGHEMRFVTIRWRVPARSAVGVGVALAGVGLESADVRNRWHLMRDGAGPGRTVVATVVLEGDVLTGEVNSRERAAVLSELVGRALPGAELLGRDERTMDEVRSEVAVSGASVSPASSLAPAPDSPELREAMGEYIRAFEAQWLDDHIPALHGRTPREAVTDPIGREELSQLLDSFPDVDPTDFTQMSAERLRLALGL